MLKKHYLYFKEQLRRKAAAIPHRFYAFGLLLVCMVSLQVYLKDTLHIVYVTDSEGTSQLITTNETNQEHLMQLAGLTAGIGDRISYVNYAQGLSNLDIQRAFEVTLRVDGQIRMQSLIEGTVLDVLNSAGVTLDADDYTVPSLHTELKAGDEINVYRVEYVETVEYEEIPYETVYSYTSEFYKRKNTTVVRQKGRVGEKAITSRERWVNGVMESSQVMGTEITRQPTDEIIRAYKAGAPVSSRTGPDGTTNKPTSYTKVLTGRATGYYSKTGGKGASRLGLGYGTVAVDPRVIPYGTLLYIESTDGRFVYGYAIATDTGTAMVEGKCLVDLYYETYRESVINGVQHVNVYVVG